MLETAGKILDFVAKKSWATFFLTLFVLFLPDYLAKKIGISDIRENYKGVWGVLFILSGVMWGGVILNNAWSYYKKRRNTLKEYHAIEKRKSERLSVIVSRLHSLDIKEKTWIQYCLYHNVQTLSAERGDTVAQSLTHKGILQEGSGHILDLPFHIPDEVWKYLTENKDEFLPEAIRNHKGFPDILNRFRDGRRLRGY